MIQSSEQPSAMANPSTLRARHRHQLVFQERGPCGLYCTSDDILHPACLPLGLSSGVQQVVILCFADHKILCRRKSSALCAQHHPFRFSSMLCEHCKPQRELNGRISSATTFS
ncbi:hypothetical protein KC19_2G052500 [Ceratodon purpureus]|uniref:Uncharacterized protein n=1 Tax=Ceratodon purpureus TaxID=3225 RepID=A0A8T0IQC9_CERPU|nr:hypothetical protein KC19_2G052500 [Ceratodon purpureus]